MTKFPAPVLIYRWCVFLLAAGYIIRVILFGEYSAFGGPFRFLTIWALLASFFCASRMIALMEGRSERRWDGFVGMTAVLNAMVVFLYWRLYFADPTSVTQNGQLGEPYLEMYLHALGPALQWIDAVLIHRSFRAPMRSVLWLLGVISAYVIWIETLVSPMNESPSGVITSGLPYPFLNNLGIDGRATFYVTNIIVAMVFLAGFVLLTAIVRRIRQRAEISTLTGNPGESETH